MLMTIHGCQSCQQKEKKEEEEESACLCLHIEF